MSSTDQNTPTGKPGRRKGKKEKSRKPDQAMSPQPDQPEETIEPIGAIVAPPEPAPVDPAPIEAAPIEAAAAADAAPVGAAEPADVEPVSFQTIAAAYGDFTRKSLEETRSFVERLSGAGSLDKAMQLQTEFARQTYKTFVEEAQKIRGLHSELAKQSLEPLKDLVNKSNRGAS
jgi:phasin family protein